MITKRGKERKKYYERHGYRLFEVKRNMKNKQNTNWQKEIWGYKKKNIIDQSRYNAEQVDYVFDK